MSADLFGKNMFDADGYLYLWSEMKPNLKLIIKSLKNWDKVEKEISVLA